MTHLSRQQIERSLNAVRGDRIEEIKGLNYIPAEEVRAELIRQFGPGNWDSEVVDLSLVFENEAKSKAGSPVWDVCYRAGVTLRVRNYEGIHIAQFTEYHVGTTRHPERGEAHANAITSASSYALRRCAIGLGDNYGLHLYAKGSTAPIVRGTLLLTDYMKPKDAEEKPKEQGNGSATQAAVRPHDYSEEALVNGGPGVSDQPMALDIDPEADARAAASVKGAFAS